MAKGMSLSIGLNAVDPKHYGDWSGELNACEADAAEMSALAKSQGFRPTVLLTRRATRARVQAELGKAARQLAAGDIFMLSYSGHGGQLPDLNRDEPDAQDETWCLFDGELVDDELHADNQLSADGEVNGLFTGELLRVCPRGAPVGGVREAAAVHGLTTSGLRRIDAVPRRSTSVSHRRISLNSSGVASRLPIPLACTTQRPAGSTSMVTHGLPLCRSETMTECPDTQRGA